MERKIIKMIICQSCNTPNPDKANFCGHCGRKLKEVCACWVLKKEYNCEEEKCPGYKLLFMLPHQ